MSGISSGIGLVSGIDTASLIQQLLAIRARPQVLAQRRVVQLQAEQTAFLDLNTRLGALSAAAARFNTQRVFGATGVTSSDEAVLTGTASADAAVGSFQFIVDRLVSTQQLLSRGFADRDTTAIGASSFIVEGFEGRLDRDIELSALNGGAGVRRGSLVISDGSGSATVDLSRVATVSEVLEAVNAADVDVTAGLSGNRIVLTSGTGTLTVSNAVGSQDVRASLGLDNGAIGGVITGREVYYIGDDTSLVSLNDGNGIRRTQTVGSGARDFIVTSRDGTVHNVLLGQILTGGEITDGAVGTVGGLRDRIESQTGGRVTLEVDAGALRLVDTSAGSGDFIVQDFSGAAVDLGFVDSDGGTATVSGPSLDGRAVQATVNSTLLRNLLGGRGLTDGTLQIVDALGGTHDLTLSTDGSVGDLISQIETQTGGRITVGLDGTGTGLVLRDVSGGAGSTTISGAAATALGIDGTYDSEPIRTGRLQHAYVTGSTSLASLNRGGGVGTGSFQITDSTGAAHTISISSGHVSVQDVIDQINNSGAGVVAGVNDNGDGIVIREDPSGPTGNNLISIRDLSGTVAANLNLAGTAEGTGPENVIDGSFERVVTFDADATLDDVALAINNANAGVRATVINDGSAGNPFRLTLTSRTSGAAGRFTFESIDFDLGETVLSEGRNARVFYGSDDPARAVLLTSSTNTVNDVVAGVSVDLHSSSETPVTLSTSRDIGAIESAVNEFVEAFNNVVERIDLLTDYDEETERRGTLFGSSTAQQLRQSLTTAAQSRALGVSGRYQFLSQAGVRIGSGGTLEVDADRLRDALEEDFDAVAELFAAKVQNPTEPVEILPGVTVSSTGQATFSSLGAAEQIVQLINRYVDPVNGILTRRTQSLDTQIAQQNDRVEFLGRQLEVRRSILEAQFAEMERVLAGLQSQQSSLLSLQSLVG